MLSPLAARAALIIFFWILSPGIFSTRRVMWRPQSGGHWLTSGLQILVQTVVFSRPTTVFDGYLEVRGTSPTAPARSGSYEAAIRIGVAYDFLLLWSRRGLIRSRIVTDTLNLSRHVTDNVTDDLEKNLGKTVFVTMSRLNTPGRGVPFAHS
jgi:hypothetical protein